MQTASATISPIHDGLTLRPVSEADDALLLRVYSSTREEELAPLPWSAEQKAAFLQMQFNAQRSHYTTHFPDASHQIILQDNEPAGRLYVDRQADVIHIIDIALLWSHRGRGIGTALLKSILQEAAATDRSVRIHVEKMNRAQTLYRRLGFVPIADQGIYLLMECKPASSNQE